MTLYREVPDPDHYGPTDSLRYGTVSYVLASDDEILAAASYINARRDEQALRLTSQYERNAVQRTELERVWQEMNGLLRRIEDLERKHP